MLRATLASALALSVFACAPMDEPSLYDEELVETADVGAEGAFGFSFEEVDSSVWLTEQYCEPGELCNLNLEMGLGDWSDYGGYQESELERYGIEVEGRYTDYDGGQTHVRESWSVPGLLDGDYGSIARSVDTRGGGTWEFKFRPIVDIDIFEGDFELKGFRFEGRIDLCGGFPCR